MSRAIARRRQHGLSLIELLIGVALMLIIVTAASVVYLNTREVDSAQSRVSETIETGNFALELIGRDVSQAWSYPVVMPSATTVYSQNSGSNGVTAALLQVFPPADWIQDTTRASYQVGVFGCDGGQYNPTTGACVATTALSPYQSPPDSLVINYFSNDAATMARSVGNRFDCNGVDAGSDSLNAKRRLNRGTVTNTLTGAIDPVESDDTLAPSRPVFVSNRYGLISTTTEVDRQSVSTMSLACSGNGTADGVYQPLLLGVEDLQVTYGYFDLDATNTSGSLQPAPTRFVNATAAGNLSAVVLDGVSYAGWNRVVAVRVCVMTSTLGNAARLTDKSGAARTYLDCNDATRSYDASDRSIRTRTVQVIALRNRMNQIY
ncbi:PilW family protein [Xylophilus sp. GOD-11R]|uniref:PilW family protein n=1 Tax=Xylophilus sp. GOD-11R TaxID=3089814 RepID=UPI00298D2839|nr:PilW family protein [Xylophilus sp. GOD-11R]WPB55070.1 PilW family protein [Xylophilus sp. GOD-11R]